MTFWLLVWSRVEEKSSWYVPPPHGEKPPKRAAPVTSFCVTEPLRPPEMVELVGVVRLS